MLHEVHDRVSLALAQPVAEGLRAHPEWVELAKANLDHWTQRNRNSPGLLRCYAEWQGLLDRPIEEICAILMDRSDEGQRLRQNSPFAGVLSPREVWSIKRKVHETARS